MFQMGIKVLYSLPPTEVTFPTGDIFDIEPNFVSTQSVVENPSFPNVIQSSARKSGKHPEGHSGALVCLYAAWLCTSLDAAVDEKLRLNKTRLCPL